MSEIRLDLQVNGKKKTYTQDFVPFRKALDYTDGESKLWEKDENGKEIEPKETELIKYRAGFVAGLFNDPDLTGDVILDGLDTEKFFIIMEIINYRVLGYERPVEEVEVDPKGKK